jgi:hypothetical protein
LEVPGSLHGLIAARLDGLPAQERALLQDGAVLGKTFPRPAVAALSALPDDRLDDLLAALVRKEFLSIQSDPRAPDHGQYGFLQSLVQKVAYDTLAKKDRRVRHLAAAEHLERTWTGDEDEIVEVIAAHYAEAYRSAPMSRGRNRFAREREMPSPAQGGEPNSSPRRAPRAGTSSALLGSPIPTKSVPPSWSSPAPWRASARPSMRRWATSRRPRRCSGRAAAPTMPLASRPASAMCRCSRRSSTTLSAG